MKKNVVYTALALAAGLGFWQYNRQLAESPAPAPAVAQAILPGENTVAAAPVSVRELVNNLTQYKGHGGEAGLSFKGWVMAKEPRQLRLGLTNDQLRIALQSANGETKEFSSADLKLYKFKEDSDSLVIQFADDSMIYLKFLGRRTVSAFPQEVKAAQGWQVMKDRKTILRIALIEEIHASWPRVESLTEIVPASLPY